MKSLLILVIDVILMTLIFGSVGYVADMAIESDVLVLFGAGVGLVASATNYVVKPRGSSSTSNPFDATWKSILLLPVAFILFGYASCEEEDADMDGWTVSDGDCDDSNENVYPGASEFCNGFDEDCNDIVDDNCCSSYECGCVILCDIQPCGNACIEETDVCHVGSGLACYNLEE